MSNVSSFRHWNGKATGSTVLAIDAWALKALGAKRGSRFLVFGN